MYIFFVSALNQSNVSEVKTYLNNKYIGSANLGIQRSDVDRAFPNYPMGDKSGFYGDFTLNQITSGEKTLVVEAKGEDGSFISRAVKVNLTRKPAKMNLETPKVGATINNGVVDIKGWALNDSGVRWIKIYVDDKLFGDASIEIARPDVNRAFPGYEMGDKSGFSKKINAKDIGFGKKVIKVEAIGWDGTKINSIAAINIDKKVAKMNLEKPSNNQTSNGAKLNVTGWALNESGIKEVKLYVDNEFLGNATLKQERVDVARVFSAYKDAKDSGFTGELNVAKFSEGNHIVKAVAIGNDGVSTTMEKVVELAKKVIVIDSAYNVNAKNNINLGEVFTCNGKQYKESEINMQLALNLRNELNKLGYKVILTQDPYKQNQAKMDIEDINGRINTLKNANADMFISIECNKDKDKDINGTKVFYNAEEDKIITKNNITKSAKLANALFDTITAFDRFEDSSLLTRNYYLLRMVNVPSVIVQPGYLSNEEDAKKLIDKKSQVKIATDMAKAVHRSFKEF